MKRKIYDRLLHWKNESKGKTALLIEGARRVGKSYIVGEFAEREYSSHLIINFSSTSLKIKKNSSETIWTTSPYCYRNCLT